jgi:hypothetical protein
MKFLVFVLSLIFECNHSKTVYDLKNVKIEEKSLKIRQLLPILASMIEGALWSILEPINLMYIAYTNT